MEGDEILIAEEWIDPLLKTDATLLATVQARVFDELAPLGTAYPFITYQVESPNDINAGVGMALIMTEVSCTVRVVAETTDDAVLKPIASRIYALMQGAMNVVTPSGLMMACVRERPFRMVEEDEGKQVRHLGHVFMIQVQAA